jgi:hypothetical protein
METLQELADTLAAFDEASALKLARDEANPFAKVRDKMGDEAAKTLAPAFATAYSPSDLFAILRFHRKMTGVDLLPWLDGSAFSLWMSADGLGFVETHDLAARAWNWLDKQPA